MKWNKENKQMNNQTQNKKKVSLSCLNCKNLKGNFVYAQYLTEISNIIYLNELWTKKNEINIINDLVSSKFKKNRPIYKSDMTDVPTKGRPFGGQCWLLDDSCDILESEFISRHLSFVNFKIFDSEFIAIGVYMPFNDPKKEIIQEVYLKLHYLEFLS